MSDGLKMVLLVTVLGGVLMPAPAAAQGRSHRGAGAYCANVIGGIFSTDPSELSASPNGLEGWYCAGLVMPLIGLPEGFDRFAHFCSIEKGFGVLVTYTDLYGIMPVFMCLSNIVTPTLSPAAFNAERGRGFLRRGVETVSMPPDDPSSVRAVGRPGRVAGDTGGGSGTRAAGRS